MPNHPERSLNEIRLVRGQTKTLKIKVKQKSGRLAKLQGATLYMSIQQKPGEPVLVTKTTNDDIVITDQDKGEATITLTSDDTALLSVGTYRYDVWVEFPGNPPTREPVVQFAMLRVIDSVTTFE
jgi:hypothetical protein